MCQRGGPLAIVAIGVGLSFACSFSFVLARVAPIVRSPGLVPPHVHQSPLDRLVARDPDVGALEDHLGCVSGEWGEWRRWDNYAAPEIGRRYRAAAGRAARVPDEAREVRRSDFDRVIVDRVTRASPCDLPWRRIASQSTEIGVAAMLGRGIVVGTQPLQPAASFAPVESVIFIGLIGLVRLLDSAGALEELRQNQLGGQVGHGRGQGRGLGRECERAGESG
jgi:hypothetical protein